MKKAFIALLATIIGTFGYAVVDKTIEQRVATLESQVASQEDVIESLHWLGKYTITNPMTTEPTTRNITTTMQYVTTTTNEDTEHTIHSKKTLPDRMKVIIYDNGTIKNIKVGDRVDESDANYPIQEICINEIRGELIDSSEETTYIYDDNYETKPSILYTKQIYHIEVDGYLDKSYAGKTITVACYYDNYMYSKAPTLSGKVNDDGTFTCVGDYSNDYYLYTVSVYPSKIS